MAAMIDWRQILRKFSDDGNGVLVTLVGVQGSSYRRVGARLLLGTGGEMTGSISGGCLEGDLVRRAKWLIQQGPVVQRYVTGFDDTSEIPYGLGCGGDLDLLLEDVLSAEMQALFAEVRQVLGGGSRRVVTWLPDEGRPLRRVILQLAPDGEATVVFASPGLSDAEVGWAAEYGVAGSEADPVGRRVFVETLHPPQRLVVCGAGEDARPLVTLGALLGWSVVVADGRRQLVTRERFPAADRLLVLGAGEQMDLRAEDAVVLMTHSYDQDRMLLEMALPIAPRYLGLLGARHRSSLLVSEAAASLGLSVAACCERLYAPVGLDLGGDGAEAIALAIVAEIQTCIQGKPGLSRRLRPEEVADQIQQGGASQYLQAQCALGAA